MFDRFTDRARKIMGHARAEAFRFNHEYIGTEHILLGLLKEDGLAAMAIESFGISPAKIVQEVERIVQSGVSELVLNTSLPFTPRAKVVLECAYLESQGLGHDYIGDEHLLLGLVRENEGVGAQVLINLGARLEDVRNYILRSVGEPPRFFVFANGVLRTFHHESGVLDYAAALEQEAPGTKVEVIEGRRRNLKPVSVTTVFSLE